MTSGESQLINLEIRRIYTTPEESDKCIQCEADNVVKPKLSFDITITTKLRVLFFFNSYLLIHCWASPKPP